MILGPLLLGFLAAAVTVLIQWLPTISTGVVWKAPVLVLGVTVVAMVIQRFLIDRRPGTRGYDGLADLMIHIHSPANPDSGARWWLRSFISSVLGLTGGIAGPEGGASELIHGIRVHRRPRSARWYEQSRRTDAGVALAAGISAAFGAPFAAILIPIEMGIGGRTLSIVLSSLSAFAGVKYASGLLHLDFPLFGAFNQSNSSAPFWLSWRDWLGVLLIAFFSGGISTAVIRFIRYTQDSLLELLQTEAWMRTLAGGILVFLAVLFYKNGHEYPWNLLQEATSGHRSVSELGLLVLTRVMILAFVVSAFGTLGVFWPIFLMGSLFGLILEFGLFPFLGTLAPTGMVVLAALAGGSAFFGSMLGIPIAGGILAYEITGDFQVLFPCLLAGLLARMIRGRLKTRALMDLDLDARGLKLFDGRSLSVLDAIAVSDAMVTDFETVHDQEPIAELHSRLLRSRYPFLPVTNAGGAYQGLLTVDMVQEVWQSDAEVSANSSLPRLLEAKDLLYRSGFKSPVVKVNDKLSAAQGIFDHLPCVPVLGEQGRVLGLLFAANVRLAYDREVARRSLTVQFDNDT